jgi:hypothetical protein
VTDVSEQFRANAERLWAEAGENVRRLAACPGHLFVALDPSRGPCSRYMCLNCSGDVDRHAAHWYEVGRAHATALPSEA